MSLQLQEIKPPRYYYEIVRSALGRLFADSFFERTCVRLFLNDRTLAYVNLSYNHFGCVGAKILSDALRNNTVLVDLDVSGNNIGSVGVGHLADALQHNTTLKFLDVTENRIDDRGARYLATALRSSSNNGLTRLCLWMNEIGDEGAKWFGEMLECDQVLTSLDLRRNQIGDAGAASLATALRHNSTLRALNLEWNNMSVCGATQLITAVQENVALTSFGMTWHGSLTRWIATVDKRLERNSLTRKRRNAWRNAVVRTTRVVLLLRRDPNAITRTLDDWVTLPSILAFAFTRVRVPM